MTPSRMENVRSGPHLSRERKTSVISYRTFQSVEDWLEENYGSNKEISEFNHTLILREIESQSRLSGLRVEDKKVLDKITELYGFTAHALHDRKLDKFEIEQLTDMLSASLYSVRITGKNPESVPA